MSKVSDNTCTGRRTLHLNRLSTLYSPRVRPDAVLLRRSGLDFKRDGMGVGIVNDEGARDELG
jgi:hypothetical protein